jgi:deoxyhypusine synthase
MADTAFQARSLSRACQIANRMVADSESSIISNSLRDL